MLWLIASVALTQQGGVVRKPLVAKPGSIVTVELSAAEVDALNKPAPTLPPVKKLTREEIHGAEPVVFDSADPEMDAASAEDAAATVGTVLMLGLLGAAAGLGNREVNPEFVEALAESHPRAVANLKRKREQAQQPSSGVDAARLELLARAVRIMERQAQEGLCADPRLILEALK